MAVAVRGDFFGDVVVQAVHVEHGVWASFTSSCQSWPLLLSQVPAPLLKTKSSWVAVAVRRGR